MAARCKILFPTAIANEFRRILPAAPQSRGKSPGVCSADAAGGHANRWSHMATVAFYPSAFAEESSLEFQVVSSPLGFKVRLYPKGDGLVKAQCS